FSFLAARIAVRKRGFVLGSPPPMREAMVISRIRRVKMRPRFASVAAFLCLIVAHFECPDITIPLFRDSWPCSGHAIFGLAAGPSRGTPSRGDSSCGNLRAECQRCLKHPPVTTPESTACQALGVQTTPV